jgi:branched-chain amino acid transport system substrate-binding protein
MRARRHVLATALLLVVAACGSGSSSSGGGNQGKGTGDLVIGIITVTSGPAADVAAVSARGSQLAADDENDKGGVFGSRHVVLETCDNGSPSGVSDPQKTIACGQKFIHEGLHTVIVEDEGSMKLIENQFQQNKVISIGGFGAAEFDDPQKLPYVFSLVGRADQGNAIAIAYFQKHSYHNVALMYDNSASSIAVGNTLADAMRAKGIGVADTETFGLADVDTSAVTGKIKAAHPDLVYINSYGLVLAHILQDFLPSPDASNTSIPILGSAAFANTPVVLLLGKKDIPSLRMQDFVTATVKPGASYSPKLQHLVDGVKKGGTFPQTGTVFLAMYGYDLVNLMVRAYDAAGTTDADALKKAFENFHLVRANGDVYTQDVIYPPGHHSPVCDSGSNNIVFGRVADENGVLTEAEPPNPVTC